MPATLTDAFGGYVSAVAIKVQACPVEKLSNEADHRDEKRRDERSSLMPSAIRVRGSKW